MNRYEQYKESGIDWIGKVPHHWNSKSIKRNYSVQLGKMLQPQPSNSDDTLEPYLRAANLQWGGVDVSDVKSMWFSQYDKGQFELQNGDLLVSEGGDVGRSAIWEGEIRNCYIQNAINRVRPFNGCSNRFLYHWMFSVKQNGFVDAFVSKATIAHLTAEKLERLQMPLPPRDEQKAIADFLDKETARIDQLIANKRRQIEKLNELRQITISRAVTQGLDPDVPMKDSGVEWIGKVPAHWELNRLKQVAQVRGGVAKGRDLGERDTVSLPYIRVANVQDGYLSLEDIADITVADDEVERYSLQSGDVLMNEGGDFDKLGRGFIWHGQVEPCLHQNHVFAVRPSERIESKWLNLITSSSYAKHYFILKSKQSTNLASISSTNLKGLPVLVPPENERNEIIEFVETEVGKITKALKNIEMQILKLEELRKITIHNAVTGKIKVTD